MSYAVLQSSYSVHTNYDNSDETVTLLIDMVWIVACCSAGLPEGAGVQDCAGSEEKDKKELRVCS